MAKGDTVLDLEQVLFVLQRKNLRTMEWVTQGRHTYRGKTDANIVLQRIRTNQNALVPEKGVPKEEWRALPKQEAERYREGWNDCAEFIERAFGIQINDEEPSDSGMVSKPRSRGGRTRQREPQVAGREKRNGGAS